MEKEQYITKGFITKWTDKQVWFYCFELKQNRLADINPLFQGMKLFKGKNFWWETEIVPGTMTCVCRESNKTKLVQLWNYYVRGKF